MNLYTYVLNNPFKYYDPQGENLLGFCIGIGEILLGGTIMATGVAFEIATFGGYTFALGLHESAGLALMTHGCAQATIHSKDISLNKPLRSSWKNVEVYAPDMPLPRDENGVPIPDAEAPHTQLGTRGERYPQAREFDKNGNPIRDIDFTDHGQPQNHPNPHQHEHEENPSGGTPQRGSPKPLINWRY